MQTCAQVLMHAQGGCVVHRCQNKNPREKGWPVDVNDVMHRKRARRILGILKKSVSWVPGSGEDGWFSRAHRGLVSGVHVMGGRWKSHHRKMVPLSLCRISFHSKITKGFVPDLRSRYVFFVFQDSYVLCIYVMNIYVHFTYPDIWLCYIYSLYSPVLIALPRLNNPIYPII